MSPRLSAEQLTDRSRGIGASDLPAIAGVDPYRTPFEVYLEKIGELDPDALIDDATRDRFERGHRLEDVALEWDRDRTGEPYERVSRTIWHPRLPFLYCHPDARRRPWSKTRRLIEVKTSNEKWKAVPEKVQVQVQGQMAVTGATSCDVLVLGFDGPPKRFLVERSEPMVAALERMAAAMWDRIERRDPPPMDGSAGAGRWLDRTRYQKAPERQATAEEAALMADLLRTRAAAADLEREADRIINVLRFAMGTNRVYAPGVARAVWTAPSVAKSTAWKDVAAELRGELEEAAWDAIIEAHTTTQERAGWLKVEAIEERGDA